MLQFLYDFCGYNTKIFILINGSLNYNYIAILAKILAFLFSIGIFPFYYALFTAIIIYKIYENPINKRQEIFNQYVPWLVKFGICYALFGLSYAALKFSVNLPRPFCALNSEQFITPYDVSFERCNSSFPSAHTGLVIIMTYFLWEYISKIMRAIFITLIPMTAVSRIILAMHFPADIIYGGIISLLIIYLGKLIYNLCEKRIISPILDKIATIIIKQ